MRKFLFNIVFGAMLLTFQSGYAQDVAVKTNLLYDATGTFNLGGEVAVADKWTLDLSANYNPWTFSQHRKMKHWLVQPEARYWLCRKFNGHFFGVHLHSGKYNWGGMLPWGIDNRHLGENRYQGWLVGGGLSYGYQWTLGKHWSVEASVGVGYAYLDYTRYPCGECGKKIDEGHTNYFGPTKAALSLIYIIR